MASRYFCFVLYFLVIATFCAIPIVQAVYDTLKDESLLQFPLEKHKYHVVPESFEELRVRRATEDIPLTPDKARPTKKPSGLDSKQSSILADGVSNKTVKISAAVKENKTVNWKLSSVPESDSGVHDGTYSAQPLFLPSTTNPPMGTTTRKWIQASGPLLNVTIPSETEVQINRFLEDEISNATLKEHNITSQEVDHHVYYNSTVLVGRGRDYWVDLDSLPGVKVSDILSKAHREAVTVKLLFTFPFYGHPITNITIATGGFLYTGNQIHAWLAATQYIAPLMANFDTSISNESYVKYYDNGTAFTVQWENVALQEMPNQGTFTFQCTLYNTGDITFVYRNVALFVDQINELQHPVKVGLSDAYIIDRTIFFVRRKTIYEYHRVDFKRGDIRNWTVIVLNALDTCLDLKDCHSCVSQLQHFECNWCSGRCSNGMDRHRQEWLQRGCENALMHTPESCSLVPVYQPSSSSSIQYVQDDDGDIGLGGVFAILFAISTILCLAVWVIYAYRNPHSAAGQLLIRYRPSQWTWRRGEARYTAATIHM